MQLSDEHKKVLQSIAQRRMTADEQVKWTRELYEAALRNKTNLDAAMESLVFVIAGDGAELDMQTWEIRFPNRDE